ncbi:DUF4783 domain-containing protein [Taibaiella soli]|uniref:DUF4783 domain-containing protein n=1 Tax=Taibaiella soli TaxID=1649169 RepID=A0A2W2B793_9BACT|nr:DUF4783 domain-containing protein [Taibaiella soli]PZF72119.1 hypothetical protein DN068_14385 [Taibaiella soli]
MKKIVTAAIFMVVVFFVSLVSSYAQANQFASIATAIRSGDAVAITKHMDNMIDITINNSQTTYSRSQAEMVLRNFFSKNKPKNFEVERAGASGQTSGHFNIGSLITENNGKYTVYLLLKEKNNDFYLQEIRFVK